MRISDWSSDVCSSDLVDAVFLMRGFRVYPGVVDVDRRVVALELAHDVDHAGVAEIGAVFLEREPQEQDARTRHVHPARSEERRVGKECVSTCRSWRSPYH